MLIGADVEQPVEVSLNLAYELLDALLRLEETVLICAKPKYYWAEQDPAWCREQATIFRFEAKIIACAIRDALD